METTQPSSFQGGMNKKNTESHWRSTILTKRKSCFSIASLLKDTTTQLRNLNGCRTPNIGFFVGMLMGTQIPLRQRSEFAVAFRTTPKNAKRSLDGNAAISKTDTSRTSTTSTRRSTIRRSRKLRLLCRPENQMAVLQRATEKPASSTSQWPTSHNGRRVGAHGIPHHLRNGGDFGFLEGIPENRQRCRQDTHSQDTSVQRSLITARNAHTKRLAQDQA